MMAPSSSVGVNFTAFLSSGPFRWAERLLRDRRVSIRAPHRTRPGMRDPCRSLRGTRMVEQGSGGAIAHAGDPYAPYGHLPGKVLWRSEERGVGNKGGPP